MKCETIMGRNRNYIILLFVISPQLILTTRNPVTDENCSERISQKPKSTRIEKNKKKKMPVGKFEKNSFKKLFSSPRVAFATQHILNRN